MGERLIYLDNAATSYPKDDVLLEAMIETYARLGVSPGRGGYDLALGAADYVAQTREAIARFFGAPDPDRVVFAANATDALNLAIQGLLSPGDHVVSTRLEHNSVLRPLHHLKERWGIDYDLVPFDGLGLVDPGDIGRAIRPRTRLVVVCHGSQVLGTVQPISEIGSQCEERGVPLLVDAAQTAGQVPIDMATDRISALAFTGHKALMGPTGSGGLVLMPGVEPKSTRFGGTGIDSYSPVHTQSLPERMEAGTLNLLGIIGLRLGVQRLIRLGMGTLHLREMSLIKRLYDGLVILPRLTVYSPPPRDVDLPVLTCNIAGMLPDDVGAILDGDYGIAVRTGLQCAPLAHELLGTGTSGAVRFSLGPNNTESDIDQTLEAMTAIAEAAASRSEGSTNPRPSR